MDMDSSSDSMSSMSMIFYTSQTTPLYGSAWTPTTTGQYAGTCIFLIALAIIFRGLFALRHLSERYWLDQAYNRRYIVVAGKTPIAERTSSDIDMKSPAVLTSRGVEEEVRVIRRHAREIMPWRFSVDLPRAILVTIIAGIGYLLMLAVMTVNVGYFLSVLAGILVGELAFGRYVSLEEH